MRAKSLNLAVILFVVVCIVVGITFSLRNFNPFFGAETDTKSLSKPDIERLGGFKLPLAATNIRSRFVDWMDYDLWVRFDLPATARAEFIASLQKTPTTDVMFGDTSADDRMPWWTPPTGPHVKEIERRGEGIRQHVILDERDEQHVVVYVAAHNDDETASKSPSTAPATRALWHFGRDRFSRVPKSWAFREQLWCRFDATFDNRSGGGHSRGCVRVRLWVPETDSGQRAGGA